MELDLQSLFGLLCTAVLIGWTAEARNSLLSPHLGPYTRALLVRQDRRHLFVTPLVRWIWSNWSYKAVSSLSKIKNDLSGFNIL